MNTNPEASSNNPLPIVKLTEELLQLLHVDDPSELYALQPVFVCRVEVLASSSLMWLERLVMLSQDGTIRLFEISSRDSGKTTSNRKNEKNNGRVTRQIFTSADAWKAAATEGSGRRTVEGDDAVSLASSNATLQVCVETEVDPSHGTQAVRMQIIPTGTASETKKSSLSEDSEGEKDHEDARRRPRRQSDDDDHDSPSNDDTEEAESDDGTLRSNKKRKKSLTLRPRKETVSGRPSLAQPPLDILMHFHAKKAPAGSLFCAALARVVTNASSLLSIRSASAVGVLERRFRSDHPFRLAQLAQQRSKAKQERKQRAPSVAQLVALEKRRLERQGLEIPVPAEDDDHNDKGREEEDKDEDSHSSAEQEYDRRAAARRVARSLSSSDNEDEPPPQSLHPQPAVSWTARMVLPQLASLSVADQQERVLPHLLDMEAADWEVQTQLLQMEVEQLEALLPEFAAARRATQREENFVSYVADRAAEWLQGLQGVTMIHANARSELIEALISQWIVPIPQFDSTPLQTEIASLRDEINELKDVHRAMLEQIAHWEQLAVPTADEVLEAEAAALFDAEVRQLQQLQDEVDALRKTQEERETQWEAEMVERYETAIRQQQLEIDRLLRERRRLEAPFVLSSELRESVPRGRVLRSIADDGVPLTEQQRRRRMQLDI